MTKAAIKHTMLKALSWSGTNALVRVMYRKNPRIIMLHSIAAPSDDPSSFTSEFFARYVQYIKKHYLPMKMCDLISSKLTNGAYPDHAVAITFDDGLKSFYDWALPVLREYEVPATVFVCPTLIEDRSWLWSDRFTYLYRRGFDAECDKSLDQQLRELKRKSAAEREEFIRDASRNCGVALPDEVPEECRLMSWEVLRELAGSYLVEIGSHTLTHPILSMEDADTSWREIFGSRRMLEKNLEIPVRSFCFPNGHPGDYRGDHLEMVRQSGYACGIASHYGCVTPDSNLMALPRIGIGTSMYQSYKYLDAVEDLQRKVMNER